MYEDRYESVYGPLGSNVARQIRAYRECGPQVSGLAHESLIQRGYGKMENWIHMAGSIV